MKIVCIGQTTIDTSYLCANYPVEDTKLQPDAVHNSLGGPTAVGAILLSRLGHQVTLITSLGDDHPGRYARRQFTTEGVKLINYHRLQTIHNTYLVNSQAGTRTGLKHPQQEVIIPTLNSQDIKPAAAIYLDRHVNYLFNRIKRLVRSQTFIMMDPSVDVSSTVVQSLQQIPLPIVSAEWIKNYHRLYTQPRTFTQPHIVTHGSKGSEYVQHHQSLWFKPPEVNVVDTLGAGDIFRAAFIHQHLNFHNVETSIKYANQVAALHCTKPGNHTAIPKLKDINIFLHHLSKRNAITPGVKS